MKKTKHEFLKRAVAILATVGLFATLVPISALASAGDTAENGQPQAVSSAVASGVETDNVQVPAAEEAQPVLFDVYYYDGDNNLFSQTQAEQGAALSAPATQPAAPEGSRFAGWFEQDATEPYSFEGSSVAGELKLYAHYEAEEPTPEKDQPAPGAQDADTPDTDTPDADTSDANTPDAADLTDPAITNTPDADAPNAPVPAGADTKTPTLPRVQAGAPSASDDKLAAPAASSEHTVTFVVDGSPFKTITVQDETLVSLPKAPAGAQPFVGWYTEGGLPFNPQEVVTSDLTLTAKYSASAVLVTYLDTDGSVLEVVEGTIGQAAPTPSRRPTVAMGKAFQCWALQGSTGAFTATLTKSVTLVPVLANISMAVFVTQGSEVDPQTESGAFYATQPKPDPTRDGYTFDGWSPNEDGTGNFNFGKTEIEGTVFIYARWKEAEANYTMNIWVEKANAGALGNPLDGNRAGYELRYTSIQTGKTGDEVELSESETRAVAAGATKDVTNLLLFCDFNASEKKEISANGDTVLNVYFTRTEFTFHFTATKPNSADNGQIYIASQATSVGSTYDLTVKLEQDVSQLWPVRVEYDNSAYYFTNWGGYYGNGSSIVSYSHLTVAFSNPIATGANGKIPSNKYYYSITKPLRFDVTVAAQSTKSPYTETRVYWVELSDAELQTYQAHGGSLPDAEVRSLTTGNSTYSGERFYKKFYTANINYQTADPGAYSANNKGPTAWGWPGRDIIGYETIASVTAEGNPACLTTQFQEVVQNPDNIRDYTLNYFMPSKQYQLTLVTGSGSIVGGSSRLADQDNGSYIASTKYGESLSALLPTGVTKTNARFEGWYLDDQYIQAFKDSGITTMPNANLTLYARYRGTEVTVNYVADGKVVKTQNYARGSKLDPAEDLKGTDFANAQKGATVPGYGTFQGWFYEVGTTDKATVEFPASLSLTRDEYTLTAKLDPATYNVTFVGSEDGKDVTYAKQDVRSGANNTLARSGHTAFEPDSRAGYAFKGWSTTQGGAVADFTTATRILESTTVYAIWETIQVTLSYDANGGTLTPAGLQQVVDYGQSLQDASLQVPGADSVALEGSTFLGWYTQPEGGQLFLGNERLTHDMTVYAHWQEDDVVPPVDPVDPQDPVETPVDPMEPVEDPFEAPLLDPPSDRPVDVVVPVDDVAPVDMPGAANTPATIDTTPALPAAPVLTPFLPQADPPATEVQQPTTPDVVDNTPETATLDGNNVPLGNLEQTGMWSLLSLIIAITGILISLLLVLGSFFRRRREEDAQDERAEDKERTDKKRGWYAKLITMLLGLLPAVLFLALDNMTLSMALVNQWTLWVAVAFVVQMLCLATYLVIKNRKRAAKENADR